MWQECERIIKPRGGVVLFSQQPFTSKLVMSNPRLFKYEWIWEKPMPTGRLNCNFAPLKTHEVVLIFSKSAACYVKNPENAMIYNPQMTTGKPYKSLSGGPSTNYDMKWCKQTKTINKGTRYPRDVQRFSHDRVKLHPTQKPVALLEYLIKTYTNEGDTVLDFCMGAGSCGIAAINTNRNFVGIELEKKYFDIAEDRIDKANFPLDK